MFPNFLHDVSLVFLINLFLIKKLAVLIKTETGIYLFNNMVRECASTQTNTDKELHKRLLERYTLCRKARLYLKILLKDTSKRYF